VKSDLQWLSCLVATEQFPRGIEQLALVRMKQMGQMWCFILVNVNVDL